MLCRPAGSTALCISLLLALPLAAAQRPATGARVPGCDALDKSINDFMDLVRAQAGTVAVSKSNRVLYSRGFGWSDQYKTQPVSPDALMRIASVTKPITAATVRNAVRAKRLTLNTKAFPYIAIKPPHRIADGRITNITVTHLLDHKGGWDRDRSFDPMFRAREVEAELGLLGPASAINVIEYMMARPLQFAPGERYAYSNFGYCVLGRVLEKAMNKTWFECVQESICQPLRITDIKLGHSASSQRDLREVWYPVADNAFSLEIMDAHGGLIASCPALCRFLDAYWMNGDPRLPDQWGDWTFFGSLPGTTALVRQRRDGYNVAVLVNVRRDRTMNQDNETLLRSVDLAIESIKKYGAPKE